MKIAQSFVDTIPHSKLAHLRKEAKKDDIDVTFKVYDRELIIRVGKYSYRTVQGAFSQVQHLQSQIDYSGEVRS